RHPPRDGARDDRRRPRARRDRAGREHGRSAPSRLPGGRHHPVRRRAGAPRHRSETMSSNVRVGILMGSESDLEIMKGAAKVLGELGVTHELRVLSAHRTPEEAGTYAREAEARGTQVLIAGAGLAAHLAGALVAQTTLPVIGVPLSAGTLGGLD